MSRTQILGSLVVSLVVVPPLSSQVGPSLGTAAGLGGSAVTESRRIDAALWNPALVGIYEGGATRTSSVLALDARTLPGGDAIEASARLGLLSGRVEDRRAGDYAAALAWGGGTRDAAVQVRWLGAQSRGMVVTLDSRYSMRAALPPELAASLGIGDAAHGGGGEAERALSTVLAASRGVFLGEFPSIGRIWAGATAKGWWLHEYGFGRFHGDLPTTSLFRETVLGDVGGIGADVGLAGLVAGRLRYGVSVANVYQATYTPGRNPRTRSVDVMIENERVRFQEQVSSEISLDDPDVEAVDRAREVWERTRFPVVARAGIAVESAWGTVAGAMRHEIKQGGLDPRGAEAERTLAWRDTGDRVRVSYGWGRNRDVLAAAVSFGGCARRWTMGARRTSDAEIGITVDVALSDWACNLRNGSR